MEKSASGVPENKEARPSVSSAVSNSASQRPSVASSQSSSLRSSQASSKAPPTTVICEAAEIQGNVNFGDGCVVHPGAFIDARGGTIIFGEHNIIEEKARIVNKIRGKDPKTGRPIMKEMRVGSYNLFECGCTISSSEIGDMNDFCHKSFVEDNCKIASCCYVGPKVTLPVGTKMVDNQVAYEDGKMMVNQENSTADIKKPKMKELCSIQAVQVAKHNNLRKV